MSACYRHRLLARAVALVAPVLTLSVAAPRLAAQTGSCGGASVTLPFTDVAASNAFFCAIAAAYFSGLTNGTSATTYSPQAVVTREQMAAFVTRTLDQSLRRGNRRAALGQFWTLSRPRLFDPPQYPGEMRLVQSDGTDIYVAIPGSDRVLRLRASSHHSGTVQAVYTDLISPYVSI